MFDDYKKAVCGSCEEFLLLTPEADYCPICAAEDLEWED